MTTEFIQVYENVVSREACKSIINEYERVKLSTSGVILQAGIGDGELDADHRRAEQICFRTPHSLSAARPLTELVWKEVYTPILDWVQQYDKDIGGGVYDVGDWTIWQVDMLKYAKGDGFYKKHVDVGDDGLTAYRILSIIVCLNTVSDGGELVFDKQEITLKPKAGRVVMFPSAFCYPHLVRPSISGDRYSIVMWVVLVKNNQLS